MWGYVIYSPHCAHGLRTVESLGKALRAGLGAGAQHQGAAGRVVSEGMSGG